MKQIIDTENKQVVVIEIGIVRNKEIVDYADKIIAFWDGASKGTLSVIKYAEKNGAHQIVKREINVLGSSIADRMRDFTFNLTSELLVKGR